MKKTNYLSEILLQIALVIIVLGVGACNFSQKPKDTKVVAEEQNDDKFDNNKQEKDAQFLVNAAEINLEGIQLGQLAQQKGGTAQVKELGKMMEVAHTKSLTDLTALAQSKSITIPTSLTEDAHEAYQKLSDKSGNDFDKAYVDKMVSDHKDAIETFEDAAEDSNDSDIRNWATALLTELRTHHTHSVDLQNNLTVNNSSK